MFAFKFGYFPIQCHVSYTDIFLKWDQYSLNLATIHRTLLNCNSFINMWHFCFIYLMLFGDQISRIIVYHLYLETLQFYIKRVKKKGGGVNEKPI